MDGSRDSRWKSLTTQAIASGGNGGVSVKSSRNCKGNANRQLDYNFMDVEFFIVNRSSNDRFKKKEVFSLPANNILLNVTILLIIFL